MATLFKPMDVQVDGNGLSMAGAKLYFYTTGTSTPLDTYSDSGLTTPNANPVVADGNGLWPAIYLGTTNYKAILKTSADATVLTLDPVLVNPQASTLTALMDAQFGSTQYSLIQRGASAWAAVTPKAVLDNKFGTTEGTLIKRGASDWEAWAMTTLTNSLAADVALNNTSNYFTGPTVAQGTTGTWWASGTVTLADSGGAAEFDVKLWDGTTVIASATAWSEPSRTTTVCLSGRIASPAGNIRIDVKDLTSTGGSIVDSESGNAKDSTLTVMRIA